MEMVKVFFTGLAGAERGGELSLAAATKQRQTGVNRSSRRLEAKLRGLYQ
jgi:hypothetical protein